MRPFRPEATCPLDGIRVLDLSRLVAGNMVSLQLGDQADPATLVAAQVDHDAAPGGDDPLERLVQLGTAVAAL